MSNKSPNQQDRIYAVLIHLLSALVAPFVTPLIAYFVFKDANSLASRQAKEGLNFQLTVIIVSAALAITVVGLLVLWAYLIFAWVVLIYATVQVAQGRDYKFPLSYRFIK